MFRYVATILVAILLSAPLGTRVLPGDAPGQPRHGMRLRVLLEGHSYGGVIITEAGNDPKVVGLVYVVALVPSDGESVASVTKPFPPDPLGSEVQANAEGFLTVTQRESLRDHLCRTITPSRFWAFPLGPTHNT